LKKTSLESFEEDFKPLHNEQVDARIWAARRLYGDYWYMRKLLTPYYENMVIGFLKVEPNEQVKTLLLQLLSKWGFSDTSLDVLLHYVNDQKYTKVCVEGLSHFDCPRKNHVERIEVRRRAFAALRDIAIEHPNVEIRDLALKELHECWEFKIPVYIEIFKRETDYDSDIILNSLRISIHKKHDDHILEFFKHLANTHNKNWIREYAQKQIEILAHLIRIGNQSFDFTKSPENPILAKIEVDDFTQVDWKDLTTNAKHLEVTESKVKSFNGIEKLENLRSIVASDIQLENIDALENCTELVYLDLSKNNIDDISVLGSLSKLQQINLSYNQIEEIPNLNARLLKSLDLKENKINIIQGLQQMITLELLDLRKNKITEISGLEGLHSLNALRLSDNQISEVQGLEALTYCQEIWLLGNPLSDSSLHSMKPKELIAMCGGNPARIRDVRKDGLNVIPLEHGILTKNLDDRCLYCGKAVQPGKSDDSRCATELEKILETAEKWIPQKVKGEKGVVGTKKVQRSHNLGHGVWSFSTDTVDIIKQPDLRISERLSGVTLEALAGTLCSQCTDSFVSAAETIFIRLKDLKGEIKKREKAKRYSLNRAIVENRVGAVLLDYDWLVNKWIKKAILRMWEQSN